MGDINRVAYGLYVLRIGITSNSEYKYKNLWLNQLIIAILDIHSIPPDLCIVTLFCTRFFLIRRVQAFVYALGAHEGDHSFHVKITLLEARAKSAMYRLDFLAFVNKYKKYFKNNYN